MIVTALLSLKKPNPDIVFQIYSMGTQHPHIIEHAVTPALRKFALQKMKGQYTKTKALATWLNIVDTIIKQFKAEYPKLLPWRIGDATKKAAAKELQNHYEQALEALYQQYNYK